MSSAIEKSNEWLRSNLPNAPLGSLPPEQQAQAAYLISESGHGYGDVRQIQAEAQKARRAAQRAQRAEAVEERESQEFIDSDRRVAESQAFYTSIGYGHYGGKYQPFTVPEGAYVKRITESELGLTIELGSYEQEGTEAYHKVFWEQYGHPEFIGKYAPFETPHGAFIKGMAEGEGGLHVEFGSYEEESFKLQTVLAEADLRLASAQAKRIEPAAVPTPKAAAKLGSGMPGLFGREDRSKYASVAANLGGFYETQTFKGQLTTQLPGTGRESPLNTVLGPEAEVTLIRQIEDTRPAWQQTPEVFKDASEAVKPLNLSEMRRQEYKEGLKPLLKAGMATATKADIVTGSIAVAGLAAGAAAPLVAVKGALVGVGLNQLIKGASGGGFLSTTEIVESAGLGSAFAVGATGVAGLVSHVPKVGPALTQTVLGRATLSAGITGGASYVLSGGKPEEAVKGAALGFGLSLGVEGLTRAGGYLKGKLVSPERALYNRVVKQVSEPSLTNRLLQKISPERSMYKRVVGQQERLSPEKALFNRVTKLQQDKPSFTTYSGGGGGSARSFAAQTLIVKTPQAKVGMKPWVLSTTAPQTIVIPAASVATQVLKAKSKQKQKTMQAALTQAQTVQTQRSRQQTEMVVSAAQAQRQNPFTQYKGASFYQQRSRREEDEDLLVPVYPLSGLKHPSLTASRLTGATTQGYKISSLPESISKAGDTLVQRNKLTPKLKPTTRTPPLTVPKHTPRIFQDIAVTPIQENVPSQIQKQKQRQQHSLLLRFQTPQLTQQKYRLKTKELFKRKPTLSKFLGKWHFKRHPVATVPQNLRIVLGSRKRARTKRKRRR